MPLLMINRDKAGIGRNLAHKRIQGDQHRRILMLEYAERSQYPDPHPEFLLDFADNRLRWSFAFLDFAARKLPHPREVRITQKAPGDEHTTRLCRLPDQGTDNIDSRFFG